MTTPDSILERLDFDATVPCHWSAGDRPCVQPAIWQLTVHLTRDDTPMHLFGCDDHAAAFTSHLEQCCNCATLYRLTRTERI